MNRIAFLDTVYPDVLKHDFLNMGPATYKERLDYVLALGFGTSLFYSEAFKSYGWEAIDIIANDTLANRLYMKEKGYSYCDDKDTVKRIILDFGADVVYCQDLSFLNKHDFQFLRNSGVKTIVSQHSCPWAGDDRIKNFDIVFTSFPHYIDRIKALGVNTGFLQIGFGGDFVLNYLSLQSIDYRRYDVTFVGGIGPNQNGGHWSSGTDTLNYVAEQIGTFKWWGYGEQYANQALLSKYNGKCWGLAMYEIYAQSKIVINRHGEVAEGYSNNMRLFESTGCGALLMTEKNKNIDQYFIPGQECVTYDSKEDLVNKINYYLEHEDERIKIAEAGQRRTLKDHTYKTILKPVSDLLLGMV